jgi:simple sugar transport system ATP-binding protein
MNGGTSVVTGSIGVKKHYTPRPVEPTNLRDHDTDDTDPYLRMRGITKRFPGVVANDDVDFAVRRGEIHGLLGENGAGKSTLMKVLYGLYGPDAGEIRIDGDRVAFDSPQDAIERGIGMVHQHFMLIPRLSVTKNVVLGTREPAAWAGSDGSGESRSVVASVRDWLAGLFSLGLDTPRDRIEALAAEYGLSVDPDAPVWELDIGEKQRVEILKALYRDADLLILDEPTAVLTPTEAEELFETLRRLADDGLSIVFITHKLGEVTAVTDRVTVLRDGRRIDTVDTDTVGEADLARMMVGRDVLFDLQEEDAFIGDPVLRATDLRVADDRGLEALHGIDVTVRAGEIVGIAGVSGNGQTELVESLVGLREVSEGRIEVGGRDLTGESPRAFVDAGVSYVPEDRIGQACAPDLSIMHNLLLKSYRNGSGLGVDYDDAKRRATELIEEYDIRGVRDVTETPAGDLSGGNLQKLILARELSRDPDVLVANQPTRGVDVGAIEFLRETLLEQRADGTGILLVSEDVDEVFELSDRVLVISGGEIVAETTPESADRETVGLWMAGEAPDTVAAPTRTADAAADGGSATRGGENG